MNLLVVLPVLAVFLLLAWRRVSLITWAAAWIAGIFVVLRWGFAVPIPASVIGIYMSIVSLAIVAYVTSSDDRREAVARPMVRLIVEPRFRPLLFVVVVLIPAVAAGNVWRQMRAPLEPPFFARTVHPASPATVTVHDKIIDLDAGENPFRSLEKTSPEEFRKHLAEGKRVYYENCVFCHGDNLHANGMFVHALNPIPTNFDDAGTIPMLRETFLFWRISKGGPGMPEEGGPWDSAMPAWENLLKEDDMWNVILFLYDFTGRRPRASENVKDVVEKHP
jgi:mono/diheme cytochrome c family protein